MCVCSVYVFFGYTRLRKLINIQKKKFVLQCVHGYTQFLAALKREIVQFTMHDSVIQDFLTRSGEVLFRGGGWVL